MGTYYDFLYFQMSNNRHCCVPLCTKRGPNLPDGSKIAFFKWPNNDKVLSRTWEVAIRRDIGPYFSISNQTKVCSVHFKKDEISKTLTGIHKLKPGSIPSVFAWTLEKKYRAPPKERPQPLFPETQDRDGVLEEQHSESTCGVPNTDHADLDLGTSGVLPPVDDITKLKEEIAQLNSKFKEKEQLCDKRLADMTAEFLQIQHECVTEKKGGLK